MDFDLSEDLLALQEVARRFAADQIAPNAREWDREASIPRDIVAKLGELGFLGIFIPAEYGGCGFGDLEAAVIMEEIARHCGATALMLDAHNALCSAHLILAANDAQKIKYLPALAKGEYLGAWALTEPGCGSDAAALTTEAKLEGDTWVLNGAKHWITNGHHAGVFVITAKTTPEGGANGISAFIVERDTPGLIIGPKEDKMGMRASDTVGLTLEDLRIPSENLCGELNHGFLDAKKVLERVMPGAKWEVWESQHFGASTGVIAKLAIRIEEFLTSLPAETKKVSGRAVKKALDVGPNVPTKTYKLARDRALEAVPWVIEGAWLARMF